MQKPSRPLILVCNDDGYQSPGLSLLTRVARCHGEVVAVAPATVQSGMASAVTVGELLKASLVERSEGFKLWKVCGTPADCAKLALGALLGGRQPDLMLSGVNHGLNAGLSVLYSGTLGAAFEGMMHGVPSVALSYDDFNPEASLDECRPWVEEAVRKALEHGVPPGVCLNVNIPKGEARGVKLTCPAPGKWVEEFEPRLETPHERHYVMNGYYLEDCPDDDTTDYYWLRRGWVSISPVDVDQARMDVASQLSGIWERDNASAPRRETTTICRKPHEQFAG